MNAARLRRQPGEGALANDRRSNPANAPIARQENSRSGIVVSKYPASCGTETGARKAVKQLDQMAERPAEAVEPPDT
jgi:hypothetical protein